MRKIPSPQFINQTYLRLSPNTRAVAAEKNRRLFRKSTGDAPLPPKVKEWIDKNKPPLAESEIKTHLEEQIRNLLFPVLSLKGVEITHETAWKDLRSRFREEHGMRLTESDIRDALEESASDRCEEPRQLPKQNPQ